MTMLIIMIRSSFWDLRIFNVSNLDKKAQYNFWIGPIPSLVGDVELYGGQSSIKCCHATTAWWAEQGSCEPISELRARSRERLLHKALAHFWAIWGNCGPFWVIFEPLWIILGHSRAILGHLGSYLGHFGPFWVILGHFWAICSRDSRETLKYCTFGRKKFGFRAMSQRILKLCVASLLNILCFPATVIALSWYVKRSQ